MSLAAINGLDWSAPERAMLERLRSVLMPPGGPGLANAVGIAADLAAINETGLKPPAVYLIYGQPRLTEATPTRAVWQHLFSIVVVAAMTIPPQMVGPVSDGVLVQHEGAIPIVLAVSQALHGWDCGITGFGPLVPEQGPPVGYSDAGNAFVVLRFACDATSVAQPGVNPKAGRPR
ncbi:MAG: hypothetical protein RLZZ494_175 [Pseudomonadota bacterium]|jgi:hypothetical protein